MTDVFIGDIKVLLSSFFEGKKFSSIYVLLDENTSKHCYSIVKDSIPSHNCIEIPSGEVHKNLKTCEDVWSSLTQGGADRKALLMNLGGGVITDLGGFCASVYKRGISFINIPTTLLGMVDASIGGKVGVDFNSYKNHLGLFNNSEAIFVDKVFLNTLEKRQVRSGIAEMLKHAIISDIDINKIVAAAENFQLTDEMIRDAINFKSGVVERDFYEEHYRKVLNFGHTIGHAVESYFMNSSEQLVHGEAVLVGLVCELYLSYEKLDLRDNDFHLLVNIILRIFKFRKFTSDEMNSIAEITTQDKKNQSEQIKGVLLETIGSPKIDVVLSAQDIKSALKYYNSLV